LLIYKFALFWDAGDVGNNVDFNDALAGSALLRLPLTVPLLSLFALPALALLWREDRRLALLFGLMIANLCATFLLVFVFGRLRHPVTPLLVLLAAYSITQLLSAERRIVLRRFLLAAGMVALLLLGSRWVLNPAPRLPAERTYSSLPQDARVLDARFGEVILRGWRPVRGWESGFRQWAHAGEAYAIELFWQVTQPVSNEYLFNLRYQHGGEARAEISERLGVVSFPEFPTPLWDTETIYGEIVSLRFTHEVDGYEAGQIRIGVWYWDSEGLIVNVPFSAETNDIALQSVAIYGASGSGSVPADALLFGEQIALTQVQVPEVIRTGEQVTVRLHWMASAEIERDLHLFLHLEDASGTLVAQHDGLPVPDLTSAAWMPGYELVGEYTLTLPDRAGEYRLYAGLYDQAGRLSVQAPDNRPLLLTLSAE
jgi:hypothetical protein